MSAVDYVLKPLQFDKLKSAVQKFMSAHAMPNNYPIGVLRDNFLITVRKNCSARSQRI